MFSSFLFTLLFVECFYIKKDIILFAVKYSGMCYNIRGSHWSCSCRCPFLLSMVHFESFVALGVRGDGVTFGGALLGALETRGTKMSGEGESCWWRFCSVTEEVVPKVSLNNKERNNSHNS